MIAQFVQFQLVPLHADNEDNLDYDSSICTVSIGTSRDIEFYDHRDTEKSLGAKLKSISLHDRSLYVMKPGCQQLYKHRMAESSIEAGKEGYCLSFRKMQDTVNIPTTVSQRFDDNEVSFGGVKTHKPKNVSLLLGASIINALNPTKLSMGDNQCYVRVVRGARIPRLSTELDKFYEEHKDMNVRKVFVSQTM